MLKIRLFIKLGALLFCAFAANAQEGKANSPYVFDSRIEFNLSAEATVVRKSQKLAPLVCSSWISSWFSGKTCKIEIGDIPFRNGIRFPDTPDTKTQFLIVRGLHKGIHTIEEVRQAITSVSGISDSNYVLPTRIEKNKNGVELGYGGYQFPGSDAELYLFVLGANPTIFSGAQWIDSNSIKVLK